MALVLSLLDSGVPIVSLNSLATFAKNRWPNNYSNPPVLLEEAENQKGRHGANVEYDP